MKIGWIRLYL